MNEKLPPEREQKIRQILTEVPYARLLGIEVESLARGEAALALPLHHGLTQNSGLVQGGAIASLIDATTAFAIFTLLSEGERVTTVDLHITYLRPLTTGRARARAKVLRFGGRVIATSAETYADDGTLAATALSSYLRL